MAQEFFELTAPGLTGPSLAVRTDQGLLIRAIHGQESRYRREAMFDSGPEWLGYYSSEARQALQWPRNNRGPMRIGTLQANRQWRFQTSRMTIRTAADASAAKIGIAGAQVTPSSPALSPPPPTYPPGKVSPTVEPFPPSSLNRAPMAVVLGLGDHDRQRFLTRLSDGGLGLAPHASNAGTGNWYLVPLANGLVRLQYEDGTEMLALAGRQPSQPTTLFSLADRADQLWYLRPFPGNSGSYALENLQYPGYALSFQQNHLMLAPLGFSSAQRWWPTTPTIPMVPPVYRSIQQSFLPNASLPSIPVQFVNTHREALIVLVADLRSGISLQRLRIPAGSQLTYTLDRDSGGTFIETFEVRSPFGRWERREFRTAIPPAAYYDISVYEEFLQSIAIDRTGTSPDPIEDINYQPRSIGLFIVPPGPAVAAGTTFDLYSLAQAANNAGAVRRLSPGGNTTNVPPSDPLGDILREFQGRRAAF